MEAARARRARELEMEVLTGVIRGWEGEPLHTLGDIHKMGGVMMGEGAARKDKYIVLFPSTLLILSASSRLSAFMYEVRLRLREAAADLVIIAGQAPLVRPLRHQGRVWGH